MPKAYFVKVNEGITWLDILNSTQTQMKNSRKQLPYHSITDLILSKEDFECLIAAISQPHPSFAYFANESIADGNGVWNCITIRCAIDVRKIVIYTAGRTIPLYVAVNTGDKDETGV